MTPRRRPTSEQHYAWRVRDILVGCGLSQTSASVVGGPLYHLPRVIEVVGAPPTALIIEILPGQRPDDYAKHTKTIAYNLDLAAVHVVALGPYQIRLDLEPKPPPRTQAAENKVTNPP